LQETDFGKASPEASEQGFMDSVGRWGERVVNPFVFPPSFHQSRTTQVGEMPRNFWLGNPQDVLELANAMFPLGKQVQQPQSGCVRKRLEQLVGIFHECGR